ncbi:MAG: 8-amino-7-oxononanoate synthase, partial [Thermodesulfobacteriota bacterium]|nr:8-amino-7-oxononanoate synthase [Thermodesulfobacteriota bacterium]
MRESPKERSPWEGELDLLRQAGLLRTMPMVSGLPGRTVTVDGKRAINFSSNNYLGLAGHPHVISGAVEALREYGAGSTASRLIVGNLDIHRQLEACIAGWKGTEAALVFGSGYQANVGLLSSLVDEPDLIVSYELNHASIIDGCRLSKGKVAVYRHGDAN